MSEDDAPASPVRLCDDPSFRAETGCDVGDERALDRGFDEGRGRRKLLAAIAALPPAVGAPTGDVATAPTAAAPASSLAPGLLAVGGIVAVAVAFLAGSWLDPSTEGRSGPTSPSAPTQRVAPAERVAPVVEPAASPDPSPLAAPPAEAAPLVAPPAVLKGPVTSLPVVEAVRVAPAVVVVEPAPTVIEPPTTPPVFARDLPPPASGLQEDFVAFLEGDVKYRDGDWSAARDGYRAYLARFPGGAMEPEAQFGLLLSLHRLGDVRAVEEQARILQDRPVFSSRREEIVRLRVESLLSLDRCDDAMLLVDGLSSKDAAEARRSCRSQRREAP